jgi:class 3 adenylate cyclase
MEVLREVGHAINSTLDLQTVLTTIVAHAVQLSGVDAGMIHEYDEDAECFIVRATHGMGPDLIEGLLANPIRLGEGAAGRSALIREPVAFADVEAGSYEPRLRKLIVESGFKAVLNVPHSEWPARIAWQRCAGGRPFGAQTRLLPCGTRQVRRRPDPPQLAEAILSGGTADPLTTHRREVVVVFLDLRGFTTFAELSEPEEVMAVLREYHAEMGKLILEYEGTLERFTGDGLMIFFNDPVVIPDAAERALRMAIAMRERVARLSVGWRKHGHDLALGIGIAQGFATIGAIGFDGRMDYGAVGTVTNMAARLCGEAKGGQILTNRKTLSQFEHLVEASTVGELTLKGFAKPVSVFSISTLN